MPSANLPSLLWTALRNLERVYRAEGAGSGNTPSLEQWANLLRAIDTTGSDLRALPVALRLSKRAVRTRLAAASRRGWIEEQRSAGSGRVIRLTDSGARAAARWQDIQRAAEERWRTEAGGVRADRLRESLEAIVGRMPLEHPHYPASYGPADATITGRNGVDWKAAPRAPGDTVSTLPMTALLSQAVVEFAMDYEEQSPVALSLTTDVLQRIPRQGRPLRDAGPSVGISALNRHGFARVTAGNIFLTAAGLAVTEKCDSWLEEVEAEWRDEFGEDRVSRLRWALEELDSPIPSAL